MRGLTQRLEDARSYRGAWRRPSYFESFWETSVAFAQNACVESVVELPDLKGREAVLQIHANDVKMEPGVDLSIIAKSTPGASGADLANIINEAALRAVRFGRRRVTTEDLTESVDVVIAGAKK